MQMDEKSALTSPLGTFSVRPLTRSLVTVVPEGVKVR